MTWLLDRQTQRETFRVCQWIELVLIIISFMTLTISPEKFFGNSRPLAKQTNSLLLLLLPFHLGRKKQLYARIDQNSEAATAANDPPLVLFNTMSKKYFSGVAGEWSTRIFGNRMTFNQMTLDSIENANQKFLKKKWEESICNANGKNGKRIQNKVLFSISRGMAAWNPSIWFELCRPILILLLFGYKANEWWNEAIICSLKLLNWTVLYLA